MWEIEFYETARRECPFQAFVDSAEKKVRVKLVRALDLLEAHGPDLKRPYADLLRDGIRELRVRAGTGQYRALYFFFTGRRIVITHGIVKKAADVPPAEIERAIRYRNDFLQAQRSRTRRA